LNTAFLSIYNELERQRATVIDQVKNLPVAKFNYAPFPGKWSISQILTHILIAEQLSVGYMKKKALGIDHLKNSGISETLRLALLKVSQRIPSIKYKVPKVVLANTPPAFPIAELISRWETHHRELRIFLDTIEDKNVKKVIYKHPFAGRLDARQTMVFFREHMNHHLPQIKRLLDQN
jgi:uncharacterized damage-inducible protein DinB